MGKESECTPHPHLTTGPPPDPLQGASGISKARREEEEDKGIASMDVPFHDVH